MGDVCRSACVKISFSFIVDRSVLNFDYLFGRECGRCDIYRRTHHTNKLENTRRIHMMIKSLFLSRPELTIIDDTHISIYRRLTYMYR